MLLSIVNQTKTNQAMLLLVFAVAFGCVEAIQNVTVVRLELPYEEKHSVIVNTSIEYIIELKPTWEQTAWPVRVWLSSPQAHASHPILVTARQSSSALTWQLPWISTQGLFLFELERTLCPSGAARDGGSNPECDEEDISPWSVTLHISSTCASSTEISFLLTPARDWLLGYQQETEVVTTVTAPRVHYYDFLPQQDSVRLIISSEDDACGIVSVQNYSCPIHETEVDVHQTGQRMSVLRSGGVQLARSRYPAGFYVVLLVRTTDADCKGEGESDEDWLWNEMLWGIEYKEAPLERRKTYKLTIEPSLTRAQYAIATSVTLVFLASFYLFFATAVFAQRFEVFRKYVEPATPAQTDETQTTEIDSVQPNGRNRERRDSNATFDSSDLSDSDSDTEAGVTRESQRSREPPVIAVVEATNGGTQLNGVQTTIDGTNQQQDVNPPTPYGLPTRLRLAALSRRHARVIKARSDRYLWILITVAVFYALPVVQFVVAFQVLMNVSGSLDVCYYNFLCAHPAGQVSDFNHVFSNLGYLMLGILFILQVNRRRIRRKKLPMKDMFGIPPHYGILYSLGVSMMVVALLSATYHICPNRLNFQFDTAFMYVMAVISMVKIYQSRHPDVNARAHATFGVLAAIIALGVWGVLGGSALFWGLFTVLHIFTFLLLSLRIYYVGQFRFEKDRIQTVARQIASMPKSKPLYKTRMVMLVLANCANWALAFYGMWAQGSDFASHLLQVLLGNLLLYMIFYLTMKLLHGERPRWYSWCFLAGATMAWVPALYFFVSGSTSWSTTPALSRGLNHECRVLQFYDSHDLWHLLSAIALYLSFNLMLTWDDGLAAVKRTEIAVF